MSRVLNSMTVLPSSLPSLQTLLTIPLSQPHYPHLQLIIKALTQYQQKCVKNRQYIEAQKAKDKIEQAHQCIKRRNNTNIIDKMQNQIRKLEEKHEEERVIFMEEWDMRFEESMAKRRKMNQQQITRLQQQIQLALPTSYTPDQKHRHLRNQQKKHASHGNFIEAQKLKDQIQNYELHLIQKHSRLRNQNIKKMLEQLQEKHEKDRKQRQKNNKNVIDDIIRERNKKYKELEEKQVKEMRELRWMCQEEMKVKG